MIVILASLFLLNANNHMKIQFSHSYEELCEEYKTIEDEVVYDLINQAFLGKDIVLPDSIKWNIYCFTIPHSRELKSFIANVSNELINKNDKYFIKSQLDATSYLWNNKRLNNARCLIPKDYYEEEENDTIDYWDKYEANFGYGGKHSFSKPIFNRDRTLAVIEHKYYFGFLYAGNVILLYKKEKCIWTLLERQYILIS